MALDTRAERTTIRSFGDHAAMLGGQHVVVTGVGGGIGMAVARAFAEVGAVVIGLDRTEELALKVVTSLPSRDDEHVGVGVDLSNPEDLADALRRVRGVSKDIAALINVAGYAADAPAQMVTQESLRLHMQVNFNSAVHLAQQIGRLMIRSGGGSIVNVSSVTGLDGNPGQLAYGASKSALNNATRILSMELAPLGVRVNAVAPGVVDTPMTQTLADDRRALLVDRVSMRRMASPDEIASSILWLSSSAASFVTGQVLRVDGGMSA